jgi:hypothetical protein
MQAELDEYLRRTAFPGGYMEWNTLAGASNVAVREISCDDAAVEAGLALLSIQGAPQVIRTGWFERARSDVPGSIPASIGLAYVANAEGNQEVADAILDSIDPAKTPLRWRNWAASLYLGLAVSRAARESGTKDDWVQKGMRWYPEQSLDADDPDVAQAYFQAAYFYLNDDQENSLARGVEFARKAVAARPEDWVSGRMAAIRLQNGPEPATAVEYWKIVAHYADDPSVRQEAAKQVRLLSREVVAPTP